MDRISPATFALHPHADLAEARRLIEKHGYWRRKEELVNSRRQT